MNDIEFYKKGNKIYIKKKNRGKFTDYCGGKVTDECIQRGKNSPNPKIRKRATFAANARVWKHQQGGTVKNITDNLWENLKEVKYGNGNYNNVNTKLFSKYPTQANGHRDDRVKLVNHPSHPSRGKWSNNNKIFNLSDFGMENPNLTFFGLADGNDPNAVLKYKNDYILPEITVTPHGAYIDNTYDQIRLYPKTNVLKYLLGGVFKFLKFIPKKFKPVLDSNLMNNPYFKKLLLQRILEKINSGRGMVQEFLKSPHFGERASKHMTRQEAYKLGKFESLLLDTRNPPNGFNPLDIQLEIKKNGIGGESIISHNSKDAKRILSIDPNNAVEPMYTGAHEATHMSTLNYTPTNGWKVTKDLFPEEIKPLLDKQMENAKLLANLLEVDPKKYVKAILTVSLNRGISTQQAKDIIDNWIPYLKRDQEARARGLAAVVYSKANHTKNIPKEVDGGQGIFTDSSLDNLYKNIFSIGVPIGVGLYATQN